MRLYRRNFLKNFLLTLVFIPLIKANLFIQDNKKLKLKKNNNLIWYLNDDD